MISLPPAPQAAGAARSASHLSLSVGTNLSLPSRSPAPPPGSPAPRPRSPRDLALPRQHPSPRGLGAVPRHARAPGRRGTGWDEKPTMPTNDAAQLRWVEPLPTDPGARNPGAEPRPSPVRILRAAP